MVVLVLFLLFVGGIFLFFFSIHKEKELTGVVFDCATQSPVTGALVETDAYGWGIVNGGLRWDKMVYHDETITDEQGRFALTIQDRSSGIEVSKKGYLISSGIAYRVDSVRIGLLKDDNTGGHTSYDCTDSRHCLVSSVENDVTVFRNVCKETL